MSNIYSSLGADQDKFERGLQSRVITSKDQLQTDFGDVVSATFDTAYLEDRTMGYEQRKQELLNINIQAINEIDTSVLDHGVLNTGMLEQQFLNKKFKESTPQILELQKKFPDAKIYTHDEIEAQLIAEAEDLRQVNEITAANASPLARIGGTAFGFMGAVFRDPLVLASLFFGGAASKAPKLLSRIAKTAFAETVAVGTIEASVIQPFVYLNKKKLDSPYTLRDATIAILAVAGTSAIGRAFASGAQEGVLAFKGRQTPESRIFSQQLRDKARQLEKEGNFSAANVVNDYADSVDSAPSQSGKTTPEQEQQHIENQDNALEAHADGRIAREEISMEADQIEFLERDLSIERVNPKTLKNLDRGEELTQRSTSLDDVNIWDESKAQRIILWENPQTGQRFVTDGQNRVNLAKRLTDQEIEMDAVVLRGKTEEEALFIARNVNLSKGNTNVFETALALKEYGSELTDNLVMSESFSNVNTLTQSIARLDTKTIQYLSKQNKKTLGELSDKDTLEISIIGEKSFDGLLQTSEAQIAAHKVIKKLELDDPLDTRFVVEQLAKSKKATTDPLTKERAQIMAHITRAIESERTSDIKPYQLRAQENEEIIRTVAELGNVNGALRRQLNDGAKRVTNGESIDTVAGDIVSRARRVNAAQRIFSMANRAFRQDEAIDKELKSVTNQFVNENKSLYPDDPEMGNLSEGEARELNNIFNEQPDIEIAIKIDEDAAGNPINAQMSSREYYNQLIREEKETNEIFTCLQGGVGG
ncbi:MAG: hypothetical protein CMI60_23155 [Parvibaculum sp.]|nr:hypothetical protein [Parvibaculum sp.]